MDPELVALAAAGGKALAGAMATDTWHTARHAVARLFSRHAKERETAVGAQLDGNQALVVGADERDQARASLAPLWEMELVALLKKHPDAETELRGLVDDIQAALPESTQAWTQTNIARDGSRLFAAQGGNVVVHEAGPLPREQPETNEPGARR